MDSDDLEVKGPRWLHVHKVQRLLRQLKLVACSAGEYGSEWSIGDILLRRRDKGLQPVEYSHTYIYI